MLKLSFLKELAAALRDEPSLRPETEKLAEQLTVTVLQIEENNRKASGEWR